MTAGDSVAAQKSRNKGAEWPQTHKALPEVEPWSEGGERHQVRH